MSKALILDACCVEYIETICDLAESEIEKEVINEHLILNRRFSPGYEIYQSRHKRNFSSYRCENV